MFLSLLICYIDSKLSQQYKNVPGWCERRDLALLSREVGVPQVREQLQRLVLVQQRVQRPQGQVPLQAEPAGLLASADGVVGVGAPRHHGARGEQVHQLLKIVRRYREFLLRMAA